MSKLVKGLISDELRGRYGELNNAVWVELVGADGEQTNSFRRDLREKNLRIEIVKNSLFRRAMAGLPLEPLGKALDGPSALVTGGETAIDAAKALEGWLPKIEGLKLRGAVLEGEYLDESRVDGLAKMPSKADLQAKIAGMALSPGANLSAALLGGGKRIASCLKTITEKLEDGEEIKKSA